MITSTLQEFFSEIGGVASTSQLASYYGVQHSVVRTWAAENAIPMIGNAFAFDIQAAERFAEEVLDEPIEDDDDSEDERDGSSEEEDSEDDDSENSEGEYSEEVDCEDEEDEPDDDDDDDDAA